MVALPTQKKSNMENKLKITIDFDIRFVRLRHNMAMRKQQYRHLVWKFATYFFVGTPESE